METRQQQPQAGIEPVHHLQGGEAIVEEDVVAAEMGGLMEENQLQLLFCQKRWQAARGARQFRRGGIIRPAAGLVNSSVASSGRGRRTPSIWRRAVKQGQRRRGR